MKRHIKLGITGILEKVEQCKTGSIKLHIRNNGKLSTPLMTTKFPQLPAIKAKAERLVGSKVTTQVSHTTSDWGKAKFFCDVNSSTVINKPVYQDTSDFSMDDLGPGLSSFEGG